MAIIFASFLVNSYLFNDIHKIKSAIKLSAARISSGVADRAIGRWFGDEEVTQQRRDTISTRLARMHSNLEHARKELIIAELSFNHPLKKKDENAAAVNINREQLDLNKSFDHCGYGAHIFLNPHFAKLDIYLPRVQRGDREIIDTSYFVQSRISTIIHEMTHVMFGTQDHGFGSRGAYGTPNAERLARDAPNLAYDNAENWGIIVEAVGCHNTY